MVSPTASTRTLNQEILIRQVIKLIVKSHKPCKSIQIKVIQPRRLDRGGHEKASKTGKPPWYTLPEIPAF